MSRPLKFQFPQAVYHVANQDNRRNIFIEDKDGELFSTANWAVTSMKDRQNGWTRESVVGELGLFADEGASGEGEAASAKSSED